MSITLKKLLLQLCHLDIVFELLDYISLSSIKVYFIEYRICSGPYLLDGTEENYTTKTLNFSTTCHGKSRHLSLCMPMFIFFFNIIIHLVIFIMILYRSQVL